MRGAGAPLAIPTGARLVEAAGPWPFVTHAVVELEDGVRREWSSRGHRKHRGRALWAPSTRSWWIATLFMVGSACFALGAAPGYVSLVGEKADGATFFVGSLFFTSAAFLQFVEAVDTGRGELHGLRAWWQPTRIDWLATGIQLAGTLFFNVSTFLALDDTLSAQGENLLVWTPDVLGSIAFLVSSWLAYAEAGHRWLSWRPRDLGWSIAGLNLLGSVFFGLSALGAYVVPATADLLDATLANGGTFLGALCFLAGAALLLPEARTERA